MKGLDTDKQVSITNHLFTFAKTSSISPLVIAIPEIWGRSECVERLFSFLLTILVYEHR